MNHIWVAHSIIFGWRNASEYPVKLFVNTFLINLLLLPQYDDAFDEIPQFSHIAGPRIIAQYTERRGSSKWWGDFVWSVVQGW